MFVLVLLSLPLFGWGCAGDSSTASVSDKSDTPQADTEKSAPGDEQPSAKSSSKDDDTTPSAQSALPDGWKWYESETFRIGYPLNWRVSENGGLYRLPDDASADFQMPEEFNYELRAKITTLSLFSEVNSNNVSLDQYWEEVRVDDGLREELQLGGEAALSAACGGISYSACILALHGGRKYQMTVDYIYDTPLVRSEIRRILATFTFTE